MPSTHATNPAFDAAEPYREASAMAQVYSPATTPRYINVVDGQSSATYEEVNESGDVAAAPTNTRPVRSNGWSPAPNAIQPRFTPVRGWLRLNAPALKILSMLMARERVLS